MYVDSVGRFSEVVRELCQFERWRVILREYVLFCKRAVDGGWMGFESLGQTSSMLARDEASEEKGERPASDPS